MNLSSCLHTVKWFLELLYNSQNLMLRHEVTSPDTLEKKGHYSMTGSKQMAILVYVRV